MAPLDLTKVLNKSHVGKWVALSREKNELTLVCVGDTLKEAIERAQEKGCATPLFHKVLPFD